MDNNKEVKAKDIKKRKTSYLRKFYWYGAFLVFVSIFAFGSFYYFSLMNKDKSAVSKTKKSVKKKVPAKAKKKQEPSKKPAENNIIAELLNKNENKEHIAIKTREANSKREFEEQKKKLINIFETYIDMLQKINSGKVFIRELNLIRGYTNYDKGVGELLDQIEHIAKTGISDNAKLLLEVREIAPSIYIEVNKQEQKKNNKSIFKRFANSLLYIKSPDSSQSSIEHIVSKLERQISSDNYEDAEDSIKKLTSMVNIKKLNDIERKIKEKKKLVVIMKKLRKKIF